MTAKELGICMIAHRGYSGKYLMNTALAFKKAAEHGSHGAETDIRMTKDGVLVCSHNREAVLKDGTELIVSDSTFEELTSQPLLNKLTDDDVYLCTFKEYVEIMKENNMICFVELKGSFTDSQIIAVFDVVKEIYDIKMCSLQSFDFDNLVRIHKLMPDLKVMFTYGSGERDYQRCFDYGFSLDVDYNVVTEQMINEFHERNLEVALWTANTPEAFERCKSLGVEYIESDYFGGND
ncbi:MAG: hypothetical protein MJ147_10280 [Clostridia bacterium]|nr:hypothetical protein [Clostridia bacterium]